MHSYVPLEAWVFLGRPAERPGAPRAAIVNRVNRAGNSQCSSLSLTTPDNSAENTGWMGQNEIAWGVRVTWPKEVHTVLLFQRGDIRSVGIGRLQHEVAPCM